MTQARSAEQDVGHGGAGQEPEARTCTQCGATTLRREGPYRLRCEYCRSVFALPTSAGVVINPGANVTFGSKAKVVIAGGLDIKPGATVRFEGELQLIEKADEASIAAARQRLRQPPR